MALLWTGPNKSTSFLCWHVPKKLSQLSEMINVVNLAGCFTQKTSLQAFAYTFAETGKMIVLYPVREAEAAKCHYM